MDVVLTLLVVAGAIGFAYLSLKRSYKPYLVWEKGILPMKEHQREVLKKYFLYYSHLEESKKRKFEQRVNRFIASKRFIPRQMPEVTTEMKVLIAAAATQLTFGLPQVYLRHFDKIVVYPDTYYSQINKKYHKGEVNPAYGIIVLSWKSFVQGYASGEDMKNLGIHEMAHALRLENLILNGENHFFDPKILRLWDQLAEGEMQSFKHNQNHFLRKYAFENHDEFFAVAVEVFFENPEGFHDNLPDLYYTLAALLNQDPLIKQQKRD